MVAYQTPGVYYERVDASGPAVAAVRTDVAAFVGIAARGPIDTPTPVESWRQFQAYFGDLSGQGFLAYTVRAFFENGGRRCWVVRVASDDPLAGARPATALFPERRANGDDGAAAWRVSAFSPGVWGNALVVRLQETHRAQTVSVPARSTPEALAVATTGPFRRAMLVRLSQGTLPPVHKIVSAIDAVDGLLLWEAPRRAERLPYDGPLLLPAGYDPNRPLVVESVEYTLTVREGGVVRAVVDNLSVVPEDEAYAPARLALPAAPTGPGTARTIPAAPPSVVVEDLLREARAAAGDPPRPLALGETPVALTGGADGLAALTAYDFVGEASGPLDGPEVRRRQGRGLRTLDEVDEVAIVAVPDIHVRPVLPPETAPPPPCEPDPCLPAPPPAPAEPAARAVELPPVFTEEQIGRVQAALVEHCEARRDRVALLDPPLAAAQDDGLGVAAIRAWRQRFESTYAALYYPWLRVVDPLRANGEVTRPIPPSGHVAGQYARTDLAVGVHRAPANAPLRWAQDVTVVVGDAAHGLLNPRGINAIRPLPGRGLRIFGARTVSSDPDWRYVNVRRLLLMIEKAIVLSLQWAVFEPNDDLTRAKVRLALTSFLLALWQQGALVGDAPAAAFFVRCDEENNPPDERANGRLRADVGVAPSRPFEFVVLRVGRAQNELAIAEAGLARLER